MLEAPPLRPELKGSIGEGPNHSNFSDQNSFRIQEFSSEVREAENYAVIILLTRNSKSSRNFQHCLENSAEFRENFMKIKANSMKIVLSGACD